MQFHGGLLTNDIAWNLRSGEEIWVHYHLRRRRYGSIQHFDVPRVRALEDINIGACVTLAPHYVECRYSVSFLS